MMTSKIKLGLLTAAIVPFLMACPKRTNNMAPDMDKELQSSIDVSFATFMVTDLDMICSFAGENDLTPDFYINAPQEPASPPAVRDPAYDQLVVNYNATKCIDGHIRYGSIFMYYPNTNPNAKYYRDYEFKGRIVLDSYRVDEWQIRTVAGTECYIYNKLSSPVYNSSQTNLSWLIEGSFEFIHLTDPSKNMVWTGKLTKILTNTSDPDVFDPSKTEAINWPLAKVEYRGEAKGYTSADVPFTMSINEAHPLTRDFSCYPDAVSGVTSLQPLRTWSKEFHPFKDGIVSFNTGNKYQRQIYYGNEGTSGLDKQCDNSGVVLIKGNSYRVDFMN